MASIIVGTASWTDPSLIKTGRFYPKGCSSAECRLRYYASRFPIVEVDSSYYAMPSARNARLWAERTPAGFLFNVKAFRALTQHQTPRKAMPPDLLRLLPASTQPNVYYKDLPGEIRDELWVRFIEAVRPLAEAGKLGALHFQFPPWFNATRGNAAYLEEVRGQLEGFLVAIEFRNASWFTDVAREATLQLERANAFVNVIVDEPQGFASSVPAIWEVTSPEMVVVRLHGRNAATWEAKGLAASSDRFNYDYTGTELRTLVESMDRIQRARYNAIILNNNYEDQGVRNGRTIQQLLAARGLGEAPEEDGMAGVERFRLE